MWGGRGRLAYWAGGRGIWGPAQIERPGHYIVRRDIASAGTAIRIACPDVTLDLNGKTIRCSVGSTQAAPTFGIQASSARGLRVFNGAVTGFRFGLHSLAAGTHVHHADLSGNTYCGAHLGGAGSVFTHNRIDRIGGAADETYAVGVNLAGDDALAEHNTLTDIYRQPTAIDGAAGEGCPIIVNSSAANARVVHNTIANRRALPGSIGVFTGSGGCHLVAHNTLANFAWAIMGGRSPEAPVTVEDNELLLDGPLAGSRGLYCEYGVARRNRIASHYETPIAGSIQTEGGRHDMASAHQAVVAGA